ncbi:MAG TPA: AhpC/TSA family protein [Oceanospirillales bacterium]|nr:AhpC/TSA family protein [Oceanospirillales bacterium]
MKKILVLILSTFVMTSLAEVPTDANEVRPLLPGMKIPDINVLNVKGENISIKADNLKKPFILTFYRGGWCPYCNAQLAQMRHAEKELLELGYDVYFISPDRPEYLIESLKDKDLKKDISYTLLSDPSMQVSQDFGIAFKLDDKTVKKYKIWNIDLEKASGYDHHYLPVPSTYLVGKKGIIQFQYSNPNYKVRLDPELLVAAAKSYLKTKGRKVK